MGYMTSHNAGRVCHRCGKELTDAASMEEGIGPICRKLDNALLAARIPSNVAEARAITNALGIESLVSETMKTAMEVVNAICGPGAESRADWRKEVKRIEWLLSFPENVERVGGTLTAIVRALGYVGLASLWEGKASTGVARLRIVGNCIHIAGPRNADFRYAVKQLPVWRFHPAQGDDKAEWSVPIAYHEAFNKLVLAYYPNCPTRESVMAEAAAMFAAVMAGTKGAPVKPVAASKVRVEDNGQWLRVFAPYNAAFISAVKSFPYGDRKWSPTDRCWEVQAHRRDVLMDALLTHYGELPTLVNAQAPVVQTAAPIMGYVPMPVPQIGAVLPF